ncbi:MAG TPA: adenylate/guanylate cyclase domain-containing protein [Flavihumibacter sp.]|nr:adenylate/guanylate cyclase domain-containing protein [Flavihumibacter sp.]
MSKILVVDDEADLQSLIRQRFRQKIREKKYDFLFALHGREALEVVQDNPDIDMVLSDINMPEMDGLTLLSKLNESHPLIKSVIVSAYGDMENIRAAMNRGAFDFVTKPVNFEDLSVTMEKTLLYAKQIRDTLDAVKENNILRMYVDENVLRFMGGQEFEKTLLVNETVEATVAFIDICGFTRISETANADSVVRLLNRYFDVMVKEIIRQGGYVDKFIGDAIMAVFKGDYHLDRAVDASLGARNEIMKLPTDPAVPDFVPRVSIGINCGEMISGNIGSASLRRLDFTMIGDTVNTAQRLQAAATENQVLISELAWQQIKDSFRCKAVGEMKLKNKSNPVMTYEVLD